jgi:cold-inducible RNA-binding protein
MNIYVGNLSYQTNDSDLRAAFENHGEVTSSSVITDRDSGQSKGFGFVEMSNDQEAKAAISALDGTELQGRQIKVNEARPRAERGGGGGGGGYRGGGGGGGGGRRDRW